MRQVIYRGCVYRLAAEEPQAEADKSVSWQQHTDAISRELRAELGAPGQEHLGELALISPKMVDKYGDPKLGYEIHGGIQTELEIDPAKYGEPPYCFEAIVTVEEDETSKELKETMSHVEIKHCQVNQTKAKTPQVEVLDDGQ